MDRDQLILLSSAIRLEAPYMGKRSKGLNLLEATKRMVKKSGLASSEEEEKEAVSFLMQHFGYPASAKAGWMPRPFIPRPEYLAVRIARREELDRWWKRHFMGRLRKWRVIEMINMRRARGGDPED